jgi:hypothetical protein
MKYLAFWTSKNGQDLLSKYGFGSVLPTMSISTEILQFQSVGTAVTIRDAKNAKTQQPINKYACPQ